MQCNIGLNTSGELEIALIKINDHNIKVRYLFVLTITFNGYLIISDFKDLSEVLQWAANVI